MDGNTKPAAGGLSFFVYGTLLPGQPNAYLWQGEGVTVATAVLANSRLFDMGNYPMLVEGGDGSVQGKLVTVPPSHYLIVLAQLDALEGYDPDQPEAPGYRRLAREVRLADGRQVTAWVYAGKMDYVNGRPLVPNGDWASYVAEKMTQIQDWWAGIDTVYGLHGPGAEQ